MPGQGGLAVTGHADGDGAVIDGDEVKIDWKQPYKILMRADLLALRADLEKIRNEHTVLAESDKMGKINRGNYT